jgi:hypothetical protein
VLPSTASVPNGPPEREQARHTSQSVDLSEITQG